MNILNLFFQLYKFIFEFFLGCDFYIIQLLVSVDFNEEIFNCYIKFGKKIFFVVLIVIGIQFENGKMYYNNREVEYFRI